MCKRKKAKKSISKLYNMCTDINLAENNINVTHHFYQRWCERVFGHKKDISGIYDHVNKEIADCKTLKAVSGDFYLLNDYLVIAAKKENTVTLITTFGPTNECSTVYNYIKSHGAFSFNQTLKKYGKLPLNSMC